MRRALAVAAALGLVAFARDARADEGGSALVAVGVVIVVGAGLADLGFVTYDTVLAARVERPSKTYATIEGVIGAPQAVVAYGFAVVASDTPEALAVLVPALSIPSFLAVHGLWAATSTHVDPGALYGVSWALGVDAVLTSGAVGLLAHERSAALLFGAVEMIATAPQLAVASYEVASGAKDGGWIALDVWAGALFAHGVVSAVTRDRPRSARWELLPLAARGSGGLIARGAW